MASKEYSSDEIIRRFPLVPSYPPSASSHLKRVASNSQPDARDAQRPFQHTENFLLREHDLEPHQCRLELKPATSYDSHQLSPEQWQLLDQLCAQLADVPTSVVVNAIELLRSQAAACSQRSSLSSQKIPERYVSRFVPATGPQPSLVLSSDRSCTLDIPSDEKSSKSSLPTSRLSNTSYSTPSSSRPGSLSAVSFTSKHTSRTSISEGTFQDPSQYIESDGGPSIRTSLFQAMQLNSPQRLRLSQDLSTEQTNIGSKVYSCSNCYKSFTSKSSLSRHEDEVHKPKGGYFCPPAGLITKSESGGQCAICMEDNLNKDHFLQVHNFADCCDKAERGIMRCFKRRSEFAKHIEIHGVQKDSLAFRRWVRYGKHKAAWGCGFCVTNFFSAWPDLQQHLQGHLQSGFQELQWDHSKVIRGLLTQPFVSKALGQRLAVAHRMGHFPSLTWSEDSSEPLQTKLEEKREPHRAAASAQDLIREAFELMPLDHDASPMYNMLPITIRGQTVGPHSGTLSWQTNNQSHVMGTDPDLSQQSHGLGEMHNSLNIDTSCFSAPPEFNSSTIWNPDLVQSAPPQCLDPNCGCGHIAMGLLD
ncbi:hypothetical protein MMC13_003055 [Lambiella insularis]|nr:hypothetical protein [Lambiella insularis]